MERVSPSQHTEVACLTMDEERCTVSLSHRYVVGLEESLLVSLVAGKPQTIPDCAAGDQQVEGRAVDCYHHNIITVGGKHQGGGNNCLLFTQFYCQHHAEKSWSNVVHQPVHRS